MGKSSDSPSPPDYKALSAQQFEQDKELYRMKLRDSRINEVNPYGRSYWRPVETGFDQAGYDAALAAYTAAQANAPAPAPAPAPSVQQVFSGWGGGQGDFIGYGGGQVGNATTTPGTSTTSGPVAPRREDFYTGSGVERVSELNEDSQALFDKSGEGLNWILDDLGGNGAGNAVADAVYNRMTRYANPELDRQQESLEQRLAERGFQVGNEAYTDEMSRFQDRRGQTMLDAADRAVISGATERNNLAAMLQNIRSQVTGGTPQNLFQQLPALNAPDLTGAADRTYQGQLDQYNADKAASDAAWGNAMGIGKMAGSYLFGIPFI